MVSGWVMYIHFVGLTELVGVGSKVDSTTAGVWIGSISKDLGKLSPVRIKAKLAREAWQFASREREQRVYEHTHWYTI